MDETLDTPRGSPKLYRSSPPSPYSTSRPLEYLTISRTPNPYDLHESFRLVSLSSSVSSLNDPFVDAADILPPASAGKRRSPGSASEIKDWNNFTSSALTRTSSTYGSTSELCGWIPDAAPDNADSGDPISQRKAVLVTCLVIALIIFCLNLVLLLIGWIRYPYSKDGIITFYKGDCSKTNRLDIIFHILINVLSTLLLGSSNLCMQLLSAPTREDINRAHKHGSWLHIGVVSLRNIVAAPRKVQVIWLLLFLSCIPVHLIYNATIFSAISTNVYGWIIATDSLFQPQDSLLILDNGNAAEVHNHYSEIPGAGSTPDSVPSQLFRKVIKPLLDDVTSNSTTYTNLSTYDCYTKYLDPYSYRPVVLMVASDLIHNQTANNSLHAWGTQAASPFDSWALYSGLWTGSQDLSMKVLKPEKVEEWRTEGNMIKYCLMKEDKSVAARMGMCQLQASLKTLLIVTICNGITCICIFFCEARKHGLCTLGDAIESFLQTPDPHTKDFGITTKSGIDCIDEERKSKEVRGAFFLRRTPWRHAAGTTVWGVTMIWSSILLILGAIALCKALQCQYIIGQGTAWHRLWALKFGRINYLEIINWGQPTVGQTGLFVNTIIANMSHVFISILYMLHNSLLSSVLVAKEWSSFGTQRKSLRVSSPKSLQRSTYFISMPLRYGLPFMAIFGLEHWLLSQSAFIIRVVQVGWDSEDTGQWTIAGYSVIPIIFAVILLATAIIVHVLHISFRRFPARNAPPFVGTCSLAISANCHRPVEDKDSHLLPVRWGIWGRDEERRERAVLTTSRTVQEVQLGQIYWSLTSHNS